VLKKLSDVVNVVPVIAKSDALTLEERMAFKERIKEEFAFHNLKMYPYDNDELDGEERALNAQIKVRSLVLDYSQGLTHILEHHPLRGRRFREVHRRRRPPSPRPPESLGRYQRRGPEPLRVCLPPRLPHKDTLAGPHRDDVPDPLRDLPREAVDGVEGEQQHSIEQQAHQPGGGARVEQTIPTYDDEWLLG